MPAKSRFTRLDAFTKTVEDARIRTSTGGIVTIVSLLVVLWLTWGEWSDYRRVVVRPELIVDNSRSERMEIHLNISFPRIPCELLTLDVMDVSGELQTGLVDGIHKVRLTAAKDGSKVLDTSKYQLHAEEAASHLAPDYCGECYGARAPSTATKAGCCNTCDDVRDAYAGMSWAFERGEGVEQCEREHYGEKLDAQRSEGCRIEGGLRVNKVVGNFHIAPGRSFTNGAMHVHDLNNYRHTPAESKHTFTHKIHEMRFGPQIPAELTKKIGGNLAWTDHHGNPLEGTEQATEEPEYNFMYFVKVVSTSYLPLGKQKTIGQAKHDSAVPLGLHGFNDDGSLETHQYSVTSHKRNLGGGSDESEGHKERLHAQGGIPGVFFSYVSIF